MGETIPGRKGNGKNGRFGWQRRWHGFHFETRHVSDFRKATISRADLITVKLSATWFRLFIYWNHLS